MNTIKQLILVLMALLALPAWSADPFVRFAKEANALTLVQEGNPIPINCESRWFGGRCCKFFMPT